jgi:putative transposase
VQADGGARSSFYAVSSGAPDKTALVAETRAICAAFPAYGYRRVGAELRHRGLVVNGKKLRRILREQGLNPRRRRRTAVTTSDPAGPIFPNLARGFEVNGRSGWRTSPSSPSGRASSISPSCSTPGRGG